jgi:hypothetical protein
MDASSLAAGSINAVVVLVDASKTESKPGATRRLHQRGEPVADRSLLDLGGIDSILRLFAQPRPEVLPAGITEWDYAFLKGLYRASYSPVNQQRDVAARMVRELAPR